MSKVLAQKILDILYTMQEACQSLFTFAENHAGSEFQIIQNDLENGLNAVLSSLVELKSENQMCVLMCQSALDSLHRIEKYFSFENGKCLKKIEFELLPILQEMYYGFYFFHYLRCFPEEIPDDFEVRRKMLCRNAYIDNSLERGEFKYEVSIYVLAYNNLEYTRRCVDSLLRNIPKGLNYELILVNHGSNDGTKEYFESIHPDKQLDIAVNGGGAGAVSRIVEGEFTIMVSNDVIVTPHAIENLISCMRSDDKIAWAVPATPNISNLQTIPAEYHSLDGLMEFAEKNNQRDPFRWEQRVRLCNPIDIRRSSVFYASTGLCISGCYHTAHPVHYRSFPDDKWSLLLRRNGYKMMLVKDAYCHHFGSITLRKEIQQQNEQTYYREGRQEFFNAYGVDPWGTGFCYDPIFAEDRLLGRKGHINVLGINCGLGSNPLKIKEQIKDFGHNSDCTLVNITDSQQYIQDLSGVSDGVEFVQTIKEFKKFLYHRTFQYIIWEDAFLQKYKYDQLLASLLKHAVPNGTIFVKRTEQSHRYFAKKNLSWEELGNGWLSIGISNAL